MKKSSNASAHLRKKMRAFPTFFNRLLNELHKKENNHDIIMNEVFGCAKKLPDEIFTQFTKLRETIDDDLQITMDSRI